MVIPFYTMLPLAGKVAAFSVASILLHGFLFHNSLWLPHSATPPVRVKILTESLCIDCKHFFDQQLFHVYESLGPSVISLQLVPFGNARFVPSDDDPGKQVLECQHGRAECDSNSYEQCVALSLYPDAQRYFPFFQCLYDELPMGHREEPFERSIYAGCARMSALDWRSIAACHDDTEQTASLQQKASSLTPSYHKGVPWVEIDGRHVEVDGENSFFGAVCKAYTTKGGSHPACSTSLAV
jgi:hypothetical protein